MKNILISVISVALLFLLPAVTHAQSSEVTIAGTVYDMDNETIPGANVYLKNKPGVGTITDANGKFEIKAAKGDVLVISFVGYSNIEYFVENEKLDLTVKFSEESSVNIEEVVVVGLGTQRKISTVGAISSVDVKDLQMPATSLANILGGKVSGVISMQTSGEPGKNISEFWIRGIGTFGANSAALVLIDGLEGDLNSVDPADIESFSILKDASATAVYGVRGANGVVLITTKRGTSDRLRITARTNFTLSNLNKMPKYVGGYDYALLANEARSARGDEPLYNSMELELIKYGLDPDLYPDINWQDEIMRKIGFQQTYYVSAQGGGDIAKYFLSLSYSDESAAYKVDENSKYNNNVGYNTYGFRTNLDINLTKTTSVYFGADGYLTIRKQPGMANTDYLWQAQSQLTPLTIPLMYSNGAIPAYGADAAYSPYVMLNHTGTSKNQTYTGKATLAINQDFSFLLDGLKLRIQGAYDNKTYFDAVRYVLPEMYYATGRNVNAELLLAKSVDAVAARYSDSQRQYRKYHFETNLNYEKRFWEYHRFSALIYYYMSDSNDTRDNTNSMNAIPKRYQGLSSRITYGYRDTYMIDFNFGYTGSENFQEGHRFGFFPSIALGWIPTSYEFVKENITWLNFLKIRGSYGTVGNDKISNSRFPYLTLVNESASAGWGISQGITERSIGADNLKWEKAIKSDVGIEGKLFNHSVDFVVDFFLDQRDGIFQQRTQIPSYAGLLAMPYGNVGRMKSWGSDGNISYTHQINDNMSFTIRGNYTFSKNKIQNWEQTKQKYDYLELTGYPHGAIRGYVATGLFKDEADVASSPVQTFSSNYLPGDIKYKDVNGDGKVDSDDKVALSYSTYPRLMYGFGAEFRYKNFTCGVLFKGTGDTDFYHVGYNGNGMGYVPFHGEELGNVLTIANDPSNRWIPASISGDPATENPNARFPRLQYGYNANNSQLSTWWKGNSKYLRLQEVTLNYNLKKDFLNVVGISSVDIQFVGSNLYVWDEVNLWDPEQANQNGRAYPIPARYTLQLYLNF